MASANVAGKVIFTSGAVSVKYSDNSTIAVAKGLVLNSGDTIETQEGRVQFSLIDGAKVSLQPNSIYKINRYEFSGKEDGTEYAFTELIKGGLRTISGWIGHKNPQRYQLKTAVATIGIRGTEFTVNLNGDKLLMTTNQGSVDVCNSAGCLNATAGTSIAVNGVGSKPKFSHTQAVSRANQPDSKSSLLSNNENEKSEPEIANTQKNEGFPNPVGAASSNKPVFAAADTVAGTGLPKVVQNAAEEIAGKNIANYDGNGIVATLMKTNCACGVDDVFKADFETNALARPVEIESKSSSLEISPLTFDAINSGQDGIISWGRSAGSFDAGTGDEPIEWLDYIVGAKPSPGQLNNLTWTYHVFASTAPMLVNGVGVSSAVGAVNSTTGYLNFNFGTGLYNYSLNVKTAGETFQLLGNGVSLDKNNPNFAASGMITSLGATCAVSGSCYQALHDGGNLIQGAFFGKQGNRAGMQYGFTVPIGSVYGSAVLK